MKKLENIIALLKTLIIEKFTGSLEINFSQGGIGKIILHKEIK